MKKIFLTFLVAMVASCYAHAFNVFMTGDSHVCSKIYPETVNKILEKTYPEIDFSYWGKIGAGLYTFNDTPEFLEKIYNASPDLLIVHLGTNDSYEKDFNTKRFISDLTKFYNNINSHLPDCNIVFVTPFNNKFKDKTLNLNNRLCADEYLKFKNDHPHVFVIDNNADYGMYFLDGGEELIRNDEVHLTAKGYEELGTQVGNGLLEIEALWTDMK